MTGVKGTLLGLAAGAVLSATAMAQALPAPGDEAKLYENAKAEGSVVFYMSQPAESTHALAKAFESKYPGVKVELIRLVGPRLFDRFMAETQAKQNIADVVMAADKASIVEMVNRKVLADWAVPTADRFPASNRIGNFSFAPYYTDIVLAYNTTRLSEEEVNLFKRDGWKAVLDPRFQRRFAASPLACGMCYAGVQMFLTQPGYGRDFLEKVGAQRPLVMASTVVGLDRVIAGEVDFVFWSFEGATIPKLQAGAPVRWLHPDPTPLFPNSWIAVSATAPHPNAARLFHNWYLSEDGAIQIQKQLGSPTAISGVPDQREVTKEPWYDPVKKVYQVDFERWDKNYDADMKIWADILKKAAASR